MPKKTISAGNCHGGFCADDSLDSFAFVVGLITREVA